MRSTKLCPAAKPLFAIFITFLLASAIVPTQAQARKFKVLHTFKGSDGDGPASQLVRDKAGNLYGTTVVGGSGKCSNGGCGTAFKMDKTGKLIWLHSFQGANGDEPFPGLLRDAAGNLYGTTVYGGDLNHFCSLGCGVVFRLNKSGKETVLHKFRGDPDGYYPVGPLVKDKAGNFYGATQLGGKGGLGTVFKLSPAGKETMLYHFGGGSEGGAPGAGVILDSGDNIYGTTLIGGSGCSQGCGVVFKVDGSGHETVLHTFGASDGANPASALLMGSAGNLYGTTDNGGNLGCEGGQGCGTVFELSPGLGGSWTETVLYSFCSASNCTDGRVPFPGPLVRDTAGSLYGMTQLGGTYPCAGSGCGVVFKLDTAGKETVLHNFSGGKDGNNPLAGLTMDAAGVLYGSASAGGAHGNGTVFEIMP
jgi:uncharacterized repeat protein (TIGR03803 family)